MQRRNFLKETCRICLLGATGAWAASDLLSCSPAMAKNTFKAPVNNHMAEVPLTLFDNKPLQVISVAKFEYDIAIEKKSNNTYHALLLKCTHYNNQLTETGNGYTCSLHGSRFDKQGNVVKGPAETALQELRTEINNNLLLIHL